MLVRYVLWRCVRLSVRPSQVDPSKRLDGSSWFLGDRLQNGSPYAIGPLSCPVLSVTFVCCGQTVGWIKMPLGTEVATQPRPHCVRWRPSSPPRKGAQQSPHFSVHVYCGPTVVHLSNCRALVTCDFVLFTIFLKPRLLFCYKQVPCVLSFRTMTLPPFQLRDVCAMCIYYKCVMLHRWRIDAFASSFSFHLLPLIWIF